MKHLHAVGVKKDQPNTDMLGVNTVQADLDDYTTVCMITQIKMCDPICVTEGIFTAIR